MENRKTPEEYFRDRAERERWLRTHGPYAPELPPPCKECGAQWDQPCQKDDEFVCVRDEK